MPADPRGGADSLVEKIRRFQLTPTRLWLAIFGLWLILLSGIFAGLGGSPGVIQALRLQSLLSQKQTELATLEANVEAIGQESAELEKNPIVQEREIRKVLGYAGPDEIIFDFSLSQSATLRKDPQ